jgi:ElaB/YqjD/DUF883 family membrane-anchored ribosome-binding protein
MFSNRKDIRAVANSGHADRLATDFRNFVDDIEQLVKSVATLPGDTMSSARARLQERVSEARTLLSNAGSAVADGASRARNVSEAYVRDRPWTALGIAAIAGLVAAAVFLRRH